MSSPHTSDVEDDSPRRPIGRLATRMIGSPTPSDQSNVESQHSPLQIGKRIFQESEDDEEDEHTDAADIYAAMKATLLKSKRDQKDETAIRATAAPSLQSTSSPVVKTSAHQSQSSNSHDSSDSNSDAPVTNRKRSRKGVFLSHSDSEKSTVSASDPELADSTIHNRLKDLLARKREQREKREAEKKKQQRKDEEKKQTRQERAENSTEDTALRTKLSNLFAGDEIMQDAGDAEDDAAVDDKLTQQARPTRKASKKAIEDMNKETQRMSRNMQLTHQAKVKKKFSIADFAAKFRKQPHIADVAENDATTSSGAPSSDVEKNSEADTPPSSPPGEGDVPKLGMSIFAPKPAAATTSEAEKEPAPLLDLEEILAQSLSKRDKGKAPAIEAIDSVTTPAAEAMVSKPTRKRLSPRKYRIHNMAPGPSAAADNSSDSELEIVKDRFPVFNNIAPRKATESSAVHHLRVLAGLNAQDAAPQIRGKKKNARPSMTMGQLDLQLRARAALQVKQERIAKVAELRAKGIIVQTAEERERDMMEIEDLLEKARKEAEELKKKEKEQRIEEGGEASEDESDEEWMEAGNDEEAGSDAAEGEEEEEEAEELVVSGSEDEDVGVDEDKAERDGLLDDAADEADDESEEERFDEDAEMDEAGMANALPKGEQPVASKPRQLRKKFVIDDDDEDEEAIEETIPASQAPPPHGSPSQGDDLAMAFGFGAAPKSIMSPSQMFAGTMAASQSHFDQSPSSHPRLQEQDSMDIFNAMVPSAPTPQFDQDDSQATVLDDSLIRDVLPDTQPLNVQLDYSQTAQSPAVSRLSQASAWPSPSQDVGLGYRESPLINATQVSQATIDTVLLSVPESPVQPRRGRLQQRRAAAADEDDVGIPATAPTKQPTAFDKMKAAVAKPMDFDKQRSRAKEMVDEQASESDDEYAGLGGHSDDDADGSGDEADKAMIDSGEVHVNARQIAALHAERSRIENEAQTSRLYKDLMSGALRRRGDAFDLDSDEDEQVAERRRRRQREEARKRRLLLGDEKLGKLGESGKKEAFLRAIEDRDEAEIEDEAEPDGQDGVEEQQSQSMDQTQETTTTQVTLQPVSGNALKRKADEQVGQSSKRAAFSARRTANAAFVKPSNFAQVRETVSFLVDEPHHEEMLVHLSDDDEQEQQQEQDEDEDDSEAQSASPAPRAPFSARRTPASPAVVDRLLMRQGSSALSVSVTEQAGMAFVSRSSSSFGAFKVPSLLKRATTSGSTAGKGTMGPPAVKRDSSTSSTGGGVSRSKGSKSSINYAAREAERRAVVDGVERRRKEDVKRIAGMRRVGGLSGFTGGFE